MSEKSKIQWTDAVKDCARQKVYQAIKHGLLAHPNSKPCKDCGHVWAEGEKRHEYDHYLGYDLEHHLSVEPVCTKCHSKRDGLKTNQISCIHGHKFTPENTGHKPNGTRFCKECRRAFDRNRGRDAAYWRNYRTERRAA